MCTLLFVFFIFLMTVSAFSQVAQQWATMYNGSGNGDDAASSIVVDNSGNVYVTGSALGSTSGLDYVTIKYGSSGTQLWSAVYNGTGNGDDIANSIAIDIAGNVYVTGSSAGTGTSLDYATIKYNSAGVQQWVARYNGPSNLADIARSIAVDNLGNVYITGQSVGGPVYDYATIKYNSGGVQQWVARYNGPGNTYGIASSLTIDIAGNVYVTGGNGSVSNGEDYATIKYSSAGVQQWVAIYNGPGNADDAANAIAVDNSGNVYVTGASTGNGSGFDYATIKYSSAGVQQWVQRFNGTGNSIDIARSIVLDLSGNIYVTGSVTSSGAGLDYATLKYSPSGVQQWAEIYNGTGNADDEAFSCAIDNSANVYVTGYSFGIGTGFDYTTIKYNTIGHREWVQRYDDPVNADDIASSIFVDTSGNVYVTGASTGNSTGTDYATIKYAQLLGIQQTTNSIPKTVSLSQNYPNPFNPSTKIKFDIPNSSDFHQSNVTLIIYDILGCKVETLLDRLLQPGTYEATWNAANAPSGVYFYELTSGNLSEIKKMILLK